MELSFPRVLNDVSAAGEGVALLVFSDGGVGVRELPLVEVEMLKMMAADGVIEGRTWT